MFLDENPRHRAIAATYCNGCVVWSECDAVGVPDLRHVRVEGQDESTWEEGSMIMKEAKMIMVFSDWQLGHPPRYGSATTGGARDNLVGVSPG
jgi:hypothetical protein